MSAPRWSARRVNLLGVGAVLVVAATLFAVGGGAGSTGGGASRPREPVAVTSDARHRFAGLAELVASTDLAIAGRVVAVERGRIFGSVDASGDAAGGAVRSQVLTIEVDDVVAHGDAVPTPQPGTVVLVEEEAELLDGTPITVDGARPAHLGDAGVWLLLASADPDFPGFTVVNSQGRYLLDRERRPDEPLGGALRGADRTDALVRELEALRFERFTAAIVAEMTAG